MMMHVVFSRRNSAARFHIDPHVRGVGNSVIQSSLQCKVFLANSIREEVHAGLFGPGPEWGDGLLRERREMLLRMEFQDFFGDRFVQSGG